MNVKNMVEIESKLKLKKSETRKQKIYFFEPFYRKHRKMG